MTEKTDEIRRELVHLRDSGKTRREIAEHFNVSEATVKHWISHYGIAKKIIRKPKKPAAIKKRDLHPYEGLTAMEKAALVFGSRLKECAHKGYILDGRPATATKIMAELSAFLLIEKRE